MLIPRTRARARFWFPPGGGIETDESPRQAAVREVCEEVGLQLAPDELSAEVMQREARFTHEGITYRQVEHYFVARIEDAIDPVTSGWTAVERRSIQEHRWWSIQELRRTDETVSPENLATLLADLRFLEGPDSLPL